MFSLSILSHICLIIWVWITYMSYCFYNFCNSKVKKKIFDFDGKISIIWVLQLLLPNNKKDSRFSAQKSAMQGALHRCSTVDESCSRAVCMAEDLVKTNEKMFKPYWHEHPSILMEVSVFRFQSNLFSIVFSCLFLALLSYFCCSYLKWFISDTVFNNI